MRKKIFMLFLVCCTSLTVVAQNQSDAKNNTKGVVNTSSDAYQALKGITENSPRTFNYNETPKFALRGFKSSFWYNLTPEQVQVLESYDYPKYTSRGIEFLERDVLNFANALRAWDNDNMHRQA